MEATAAALRRAGPTDKPFAAFGQSHTHLGGQNFAPLAGEWKPIVANTGAWQRVIYPAQLEQIKKERAQSNRELFGELRLDELPACYSFVWVEPADPPIPAHRYWRQTENAGWEFVGPARGGITPCREWLVSNSALSEPGPPLATRLRVR